MKESKAELLEFADAVSKTTKGVYLTGPALVLHKAAKFLYTLAEEQEDPEPPKVETLHETKIRFRKRNAQGCSDIAADLCAIVLRRHLQLLDLLLHEQRRLGGSEWVQSELQRMRDEANQMLEGSGE